MSYTVQTISTSSPSICIPRVFDNITQDFIEKSFDDLLGGRFVERVDLVHKTNERGEKFKRAFIHFNSWPKNRQALSIREKLLAGEEVKIMYDYPWFWKCSASKSVRPAPRSERRGPYIILDDTPRRDERMSTPLVEEQTCLHRDVSVPSIDEEKQSIGDDIYSKLVTQFDYVPSLASKITGMILELDNNTLRQMLKNPEVFTTKVQEATWVLAQHVAKPMINEHEERELIGEQIYNKLRSSFDLNEAYSGKITGMLMELPFDDIRLIAKSHDALAGKVAEAKKILEDASWTI